MTKVFDRVMTGREEKTVGVEIEFFGVNKDVVIHELQTAGLNIFSRCVYTHETMSSWKLVTDSSVTSSGTGTHNGLELVSPPLTINEMERQLKIALGVLNRLGAKVDKTCGVHVHHVIGDLKVDQVKNIYRLYHKHAETIDGMMAPSRRAGGSSGYCQPISDYQMECIERAESMEQIQTRIMRNRYHVINIQSYVKYGTIEFRQHAGSTDFEKIFNWILITQSLVASATKKKKIRPLSASANRTVALNQDIGTYNTAQGVYIRDRRRQLSA